MQLVRTRESDFEFLKCVNPEKNVRSLLASMPISTEKTDNGSSLQRGPLIDIDPADPETMLTAMEEGKRLTQQGVQTVTIFTSSSIE